MVGACGTLCLDLPSSPFPVVSLQFSRPACKQKLSEDVISDVSRYTLKICAHPLKISHGCIQSIGSFDSSNLRNLPCRSSRYALILRNVCDPLLGCVFGPGLCVCVCVRARVCVCVFVRDRFVRPKRFSFIFFTTLRIPADLLCSLQVLDLRRQQPGSRTFIGWPAR